jgi:DNA repair protein RAD16
MWDVLKAQPIIQFKPSSWNGLSLRVMDTGCLASFGWIIGCALSTKTQYKGGLLGDEMGMGKTIQAVSLIMSDFPQPDPTF